jgi:hypothetical protein
VHSTQTKKQYLLSKYQQVTRFLMYEIEQSIVTPWTGQSQYILYNVHLGYHGLLNFCTDSLLDCCSEFQIYVPGPAHTTRVAKLEIHFPARAYLVDRNV